MYRAWRAAGWLASRLPHPLRLALAVIAGSAAFIFWPRGRRATTRNFAAILGTTSRRATYPVAWRSLVNYCRYVADFARLPYESPEALHDRLVNSGHYGRLRPWLCEGRGVVIVCFHFGNWDLGAAGAPLHGMPLSAVVERFSDPNLDREIIASRERLGLHIVAMEDVGPSLFRRLRQGDMLALLIDRPLPRGQGVEVSWFGRRVNVPDGPARIALRTGAKVVAAAFPYDNGRSDAVRVEADFDIELPDCADRDTAIRELTQRIMDAHAAIVRRHPEQWYMFRPFGYRE